MFKEKEIREAFKILNLLDESERQKILSQGIVQAEIEDRTTNYIILDNVTTSNKKEESKNA